MREMFNEIKWFLIVVRAGRCVDLIFFLLLFCLITILVCEIFAFFDHYEWINGQLAHGFWINLLICK